MEVLRENVVDIAHYMKQDRDYTMAITGAKRNGKSTLAHQIADLVSTELKSRVWLCYSWTLPEDSPEAIKERRRELGIEEGNIMPAGLKYALENSKQYDVIFIDEAVSFAQKSKWNSPEVRQFITMFDQYGYKDLFTMILMPSYSTIAKSFRVDRLNAHIWVKSRGLACVYVAKSTPQGIFLPPKPNFLDSFEQLPDEVEERYRRIKLASLGLQASNHAPEKRGPELREMNARYKEKRPDATCEERAYVFQCGHSTINRYDLADRGR